MPTPLKTWKHTALTSILLYNCFCKGQSFHNPTPPLGAERSKWAGGGFGQDPVGWRVRPPHAPECHRTRAPQEGTGQALSDSTQLLTWVPAKLGACFPHAPHETINNHGVPLKGTSSGSSQASKHPCSDPCMMHLPSRRSSQPMQKVTQGTAPDQSERENQGKVGGFLQQKTLFWQWPCRDREESLLPCWREETEGCSRFLSSIAPPAASGLYGEVGSSVPRLKCFKSSNKVFSEAA